MLKHCPGYSFFSKLDISMQYFTFKLDSESRNLCVISTPFGLYKYKCLPMGVKQSSDIAQEAMVNLLCGIINVEICIDDIGCFSFTFSSHIQTLDIILTRLEQN
jgi:hypothetical protein